MMADKTYLGLFEAQVKERGGKIALSDPVEGRSLTYAELDDYAGRVAAKMRDTGVRRGSTVALVLPNGIDQAAAMLAALKLGAAFAPINASYPEDRLRYIFQDCSAELVVKPDFFEGVDAFEPIDKAVTVTGDDVAMLVYTSGSTGNPKGVIIEQRALCESMHPMAGPDDVIGLGAPFFFIAGSKSLFVGLCFGCTCVFVPLPAMRDPELLAGFLADNDVTVTFISPKVLRYFQPASDALRRVYVGSERLSGIYSEKFEIINTYGQTESVADVLQFKVDRPYDNTPIGLPMGNTRAYLLDDEGNEAEEGELCLTGYFACGYLNLPEQSAAVFVPNPFKERDGFDTMLRTGDIGMRGVGGNIVFLNRADWMVKINGQRVEPGEVEAALRAINGIDDAAVKDFTDETGQTYLAAYYVSDGEMAEPALREALGRTLPEYMIPTAYLRLDRLPLNANGKLDRGALPLPDKGVARAAYAAPEDDKQRRVVDAYEEVLGLSRVGIDDDFFALGGDSIKVIMLQRALRERDMEVPASIVFEVRTPRAVAKAAGRRTSVAEYAGRVAQSYPLTHAQMSIYLDCRTPGKETAYNNTFGLFLPADMKADADRLVCAAEDVLNRYPVLACAVREPGGVPSLVPVEGSHIDVERIATEAACSTHAERTTLAAHVNKPFDLQSGPLCRAALFEAPDGLFFACTAHHVAADGTSLSLLVSAIAAAYAGEDFPEEDVDNLGLALYEADQESRERADAEVYRKMLDALESPGELYADDDLSLRSLDGALGVFDTTLYTLAEPLSGSLLGRLRKAGITESSLFMAAYAYLLGLLCGQEDVLLFAGENGRHDSALQNTVGMLVHNVPVLAHIDGKLTGMAFAKQVQELFHNLVVHDSADFASLMGEYAIQPDNFFVYQGDMFAGVEIEGRRIPFEVFPASDAMTSLTLHVAKQEDADYLLHFEYDAGKFTSDTVRRMADLYAQVVSGMCRDVALDDINLITDANRAEMDAFNETQASYPSTDMVSLFRKAAETHPDNLAVIFKGTELTYREVDDISDRIAAHLRDAGVGRGDVVSILIHRSDFMVTASLGALKTGAAYQPLDPAYPDERLSFMMKDASCKLLIADEDLVEKVADYKGPTLLTRDISTLPAVPATGRELGHPSPDDLFILLYTSGSTGVPKGVMLEHRNLSNFVAWFQDHFDLDETCRMAGYASYGFDACMMDLYSPLTCGACVCIVEEEIRLDLMAVEAMFNRLGVTHAFMTTQVARQFYLSATVPSLRVLATGGEKLVPVEPRTDTPTRLCNGYGPTEATIFTTTTMVDRLYERVPIGRPLSNYTCYVVDGNLRRLPPLVPGELLVAGRGVARGYLNRPDKTAEAFIANPFSDDRNLRNAYRTGDVVRLLPNGNYDFIGRADGQVKVRGFRIELAEVERVVRDFPGIENATVQAFEDEGTGEKYLVAYVVSTDVVDVAALNAFIAERKPAYMVPAVTMQIDEIPLNQNYKVNKRALPKPVRRLAKATPPQNDVQRKIFDCVADVVGHVDFGIETDLYETGLSSIGAIRLNVMLSKTFDVPVSIGELAGAPTVEALEAHLTGADAGRIYERQEDYPLTQTQNGIFVESMSNPATTLYNIPLLIKLGENVDIDRLEDAVKAAIDAHPYLKATLFMNDGGDIRTRRNDDAPAVVERVRSNQLPDAAKLVLPFDLLGAALYRAALYETGDGAYLFLDVHHIVYDGESMGVLFSDIAAAYEGADLEPEGFTGFEVALAEEEGRASERLEKARAHYDSVFAGCDANCLPTADADGVCGPDAAPGLLDFMSQVAVSDVQAWCAANRTSANALFNAAFGFTLARYGFADEAVFTTLYNGRGDSRIARSVGMFVKTLPVMCRIEADTAPADFVKATGAQILRSIDNDLYSFAEISRAYGISADLNLAYQGERASGMALGSELCEAVPLSLDAAKFPLSIDVWHRDGQYGYTAEYRRDLYTEAFVSRFISAMDEVARAFMEADTLSEVSLLSDSEAKVIDGFNDTDWPVRMQSVNRIFEDQVRRHPDRPAVIADGEMVTYAELDARANRIANALVARGVTIDNTVGMLLGRTADAVAAEYGIMKAGGAFLPLLPNYPDERIDYCMTDSASRFLITTDDILDARRNLLTGKGFEPLTVAQLLAEGGEDAPELDIPASALAYCIYTSGSTGKPKGVMIEHGNLCNFVDANERNDECRHYVESGSVALGVAALSFDFSLMEIHLTLCNGMTLCMAGEDEIHNPLLLADLVSRHKVDVISATPSFIVNLLEVPQAAKALRAVKMYDLGAEAFPPTLFAKLRVASPEALIVNGYGPTEATISCISKVIDGDSRITIGKPAANVKAWIFDRCGHKLPVGARGELVIGGEGVGRGYINLPQRTAEAFVTVEGRRAYRTGDVARFNADGEIEFYGRADNQVKLRGLRVELDEVTHAMETCPGVRQAIVVVLGTGEQQFLCGYYTASTFGLDADDIAAHMRATLAPYMVPAAFVELDSMPMTANGKIDKRALPEPKTRGTRLSGKEPATVLQRKLSSLFAFALGVDSFGADEDFFEAGGNSLLATKVAVKAMEAGLPIAYKDVFDYPTAKAMEGYILSLGHDAAFGGAADGSGAPKADASTAGLPGDATSSTRPSLASNRSERVDDSLRTRDIGDVLLTGVTGYLGIHVLKCLIDTTDHTVYCLVRGGELEPEARLKTLLAYYFGTIYQDMFGSRIQVIDSDITDRDCVLGLADVPFDTVINCAASVKHFAADDLLDRVNWHGVENLVDLCVDTGRRLVQVSTVSVAGTSVNGQFSPDRRIREHELYFGQTLENKYCHSKFKAEEAILDGIEQRGLDARIVRVGNLSARESDGEFQINSTTNAFMRVMRAIAALGKVSVSMLDRELEFSPIDSTAAAVVALAGVEDFTVFHATNSHFVQMGDVVEAMNRCGVGVEIVGEHAFNDAFEAALADEELSLVVSALIAYQASDKNTVEFDIGYDNTFTVKVLYRLGFKWPIIDARYLDQTFEALETLGFFDIDGGETT